MPEAEATPGSATTAKRCRKGVSFKIENSDAEPRAELTPEQYRIMRRQGTEGAFTGAHWNNHRTGEYRCASCGQPLFALSKKFDSGKGRPSFTAPVSPEVDGGHPDVWHGMHCVEVRCERCEGHPGHCSPTAPGPKRYASASIRHRSTSSRQSRKAIGVAEAVANASIPVNASSGFWRRANMRSVPASALLPPRFTHRAQPWQIWHLHR